LEDFMKFLSALLLVGILALSASPAHAVLDVAQSIAITAATGATVGTIGAGAGTIKYTAWRTVISSATRALKGLYIYNSSAVSLKVAIGPSGSESLQLIVPPGTLPGAAYPGAPVGSYSAGQGMFYPIPISQGTKVAVESLDSDAAQGLVIVTEFYY
jgi:hypothetical protein